MPVILHLLAREAASVVVTTTFATIVAPPPLLPATNAAPDALNYT